MAAAIPPIDGLVWRDVTVATVAEHIAGAGSGIVPSYVPAELVFSPDYEHANTLDDPFRVSKNILRTAADILRAVALSRGGMMEPGS